MHFLIRRDLILHFLDDLFALRRDEVIGKVGLLKFLVPSKKLLHLLIKSLEDNFVLHKHVGLLLLLLLVLRLLRTIVVSLHGRLPLLHAVYLGDGTLDVCALRLVLILKLIPTASIFRHALHIRTLVGCHAVLAETGPR